jgi:hypothetical protein
MAPGLLLSDEGIYYITHFGTDEIGVYMGNGIRIAKEFGFLVPTKLGSTTRARRIYISCHN